ncbi:MAG: RNA 2',3'-cyclic phosphodiesterase, partial [Candidatus Omnitrophica bacterium]|nr:RNA 2',3'-cyclic phosphodiesterase [Candidatus Omnitrophota bacterium]
KFLGEIDEKRLQQINQILAEVIKNKKRFQINISSLGAFPKIQYPRVIWVGINNGDEQTKKLAEDLEERIEKIGIPGEKRPFSTHITIGRVRSPNKREQLLQSLDELKDIFQGKNLGWEVEKITLFKSTLTPKGPIYEALKEATLTTT